MDELWKPIKNYESEYAISNLGRVKSLERIITTISKKGITKKYKLEEKILKPGKNSDGYLTVTLSKHGKKTTVKIHVAVAKAFIGERPGSLVICHGVNGKLDNSVNNIRYDTQKSNAEDRVRDKTSDHIFSPEKIIEIREFYTDSKLSYAKIATIYNVDSNCIRKIVLNLSYKHVK